MNPRTSHLVSVLLGAATASLVASTGTAPSSSQDPDLTVLRELARHLTVEHVDDGNGTPVKTFRFTGVNVQIVNGLGATNGNPADPFDLSANVRTNSAGNLILGYNEVLSPQARYRRTGSHNLVVGAGVGFKSFGGVVAGFRNALGAPYSVAMGGELHRTKGSFSVALGGEGHQPEGTHSVAVGGFQNQVTGDHAFAGGGRHSEAPGSHATILGGSHAMATGWLATVVGGTLNVAQGTQSVVSGGYRNLASGWRATVNGGENNTASGDHSSVAFGLNRSVDAMNLSGNTEHDGVAGSLWEDR